MVTKKVRTEYMKKFRDPKWETFSKCYEDSLKYRLTRRLMEHSHKPWFWEGWESGSESSGWSTPRLTRNKVAPLSLALPPACSEVQQKLLDQHTNPGLKQDSGVRETALGTGEAPAVDSAPTTEAAVENEVSAVNRGSEIEAPTTSGPCDGLVTKNGPSCSTSSDDEPVNPAQRRRRRSPRSGSREDKPAAVQKPPRAKSQPPISTKNRRLSSRLDWTGTQMQSHKSEACIQTRRESDKRSFNLDRRRARSADLEKLGLSQLAVVDDRWMTEYMRCFSAQLR
uniref:Centriole, cilia and spindle-associated protein n=1 Tax=Nothobranchius pienaari TaxID=704102 RepID=A0A1A8QZS8_9TELE